MRWISLVPAAVVATILAAGPARATFLVTLEAPGVQNSTSLLQAGGVETFAGRAATGAGTTGFAATFGGTGVSGSYAGVALRQADQFGGAGGGGTYATVGGGAGTGSYTLGNLAVASGQGVNYFGLWISALDAANTLTFLKNGATVFSFGAADLLAAINATATPGAYYGNPTLAFAGQDANEAFAFANFYDTDGGFDQVRFTEASASGFESDNHTVGRYLATSGTAVAPVSGVPEPASWAMSLLGFGLLGSLLRRRAPGADALG